MVWYLMAIGAAIACGVLVSFGHYGPAVGVGLQSIVCALKMAANDINGGGTAGDE